MRKYLPLFIFLFVAVFLGIGLTRDPSLVPSPLIGKPVPPFALPLLEDEQQVFQSEDFKGRVSLLNIWASWCVTCRAEHPLLMDMSKKNLVTMYGLNYKDEREDGLRWLEYYGNPYVHSLYDYEGKVGIDFGVYGVPETFIIDAEGIIRHKHIGPVTEKVLREEIIPVINQLKSEQS